MKAIAAKPAERRVELIDAPEPPKPGNGQALIQILEVGVCGTDREIWRFEYGTPPAGSSYLITGHESLGRVIETGPNVAALKVGDLVVSTVRRPCPERCAACAQNRPDFCLTGHFRERGIKEQHGFMAERVVEDESNLNLVPAALRPTAVLLEPLTITEKAIAETVLIQSRLPAGLRLEDGPDGGKGRTALVLGAGPVGLLAAMVLRSLGMATFVAARSAGASPKTAIVDAIGATYVSTSEKKPSDLARMAGNIDLILEATGAARLAFDYIEALGTNGLFVFTGVPAPDKWANLDAGLLMRSIVLKNQGIMGTVNAPKAAFASGLKRMAEFERRWPGVLSRLITDRRPPEDVQAVAAGGKGEIKTVFSFGA